MCELTLSTGQMGAAAVDEWKQSAEMILFTFFCQDVALNWCVAFIGEDLLRLHKKTSGFRSNVTKI